MKYTPSHEWIRVDHGIGTVGITKYAQEELGEVVYVQLPSVGKLVAMGEEVAVLESTKAAADIYCPAAGEIIEINENLSKAPGDLNASPEKEGWLFKIKISSLEEVEQLLNEEEYNLMINS